MKRFSFYKRAARYAIFYIIIAALWIAFSDSLLYFWVKDPSQLTFWQTVKGWLFVLVMTGLFYVALARGERSLEKQQELAEDWRVIFHEAPNPMWITDAETMEFLAVNEAAIQRYGYSRDEFMGLTLKDIRPPEDVDAFLKDVLAIGPETKSRGVWKHLKKDGTAIYVEVFAQTLVFNSRRARLGIVNDVTERKQMEDARREAEIRYRALFEQTHDAVFILDLEGRHLAANQRAAEMLGYTVDELLKLSYRDVTAQGQESTQVLQRLLNGEHMPLYERTFCKKNGELVLTEISVELVRDADGRPLHIQSAVRDITERKKALQSLQERERWLQESQRVAQIGTYHLDIPKGLWVSTAVLDSVLGIGADHPKTVEGWLMVVHPEQRDEMAAYFQNEVLGNKASFDKEYRIVRSCDGQERWVYGRGELSFDENGSPVTMVGTIQDVTERKLAEEALRLSQGRLAESQRIAQMGNWFWDWHNDKVQFSEEAFSILGIEPIETGFTLREFNEFIHPEDRAIVAEINRRTIAVRKNLKYEHRIVRPDGSIRWVYEKAEIVYAEDGQPLQMFGTMQDITERKQQEQELRELNQRLQAILDASPVPIILLDAQKVVRLANPATEKVFGWSPEEITGQENLQLVTPKQQRAMEGILAIVLQGGMVYNRELVLNHKTGRPIELSLAAAPVRDSIGAIGGAIIILNDITERKRAEEALRKSEAHLANAQRIAKMGSWIWDPRTDSGEWSVEVSEMLGLSPDNRSGSLSFFFSVVHPEDREIAERNTMTALAEKKSIDYEHRIQRADGAIIWVRQRAEVTFDKDGKPLMMLGTMQDITERKRQEQEVLIQLERVRALHEIDAAIASTFDLNIGLEFILGKVLNLLNAPAAAVLSLEPDTHMFHYAACKGFRKPVVGYDIFGMAEVIARMITHPQPVMQNDLSEVVGPSPDFYRFEGFRAAHSVPLMVKGQLRGLLQVFHREPFAPEPDWMEFFETLAAQVAIAIDNITLYNNLQYSNMELRMAYDATIEGWSRALDLRDKETEGHTLRVTELTLQFFRRIGMSDEGQMKHIRWGALLHDIGKMGVPDHILLKDGPLSDEEWAIMKQHPVYARDLIVPISFLKDAIDIPYCHHERWDGMGYPQGLRGDEIPLAARLFALVDVWDALRSDRPYRKAWTSEKTAEYIRSLSGKQFDPSLVETFLEMVEKGG